MRRQAGHNRSICHLTGVMCMSWIKIIGYSQSSGLLRYLYDRIMGPDQHIDNIMSVHSLRPHTLDGHMALYKNVLHHSQNSVPHWFAEALGVWCSQLNQCEYCVEHHLAGLSRLLGDPESFDGISKALRSTLISELFEHPEQCALEYARRLTLDPSSLRAEDVSLLSSAGWSDAQILEINQVVAYFNYANRTVLGLGVSLKGDALGLSPKDRGNPNSWEHQ